eukprot:CFRG8468T1
MEAFPALALTGIMSIVEFGTAADLCNSLNDCSGRQGWAVSVGVISFVVCVVGLFLHWKMKEQANKLALPIGGFLIVLWAFGVGFNTGVNGPFEEVGNGYYSSWICLFSSANYFYLAIASIASISHTYGVAMWVVCVSSIVEFAVASEVCNDTGVCTGSNGWAVAVGVISCVISGIVVIIEYASPAIIDKIGMGIGGFLTIWWAFGAGFNTSVDGPFSSLTSTGTQKTNANGYYSTWVCFFASLYYTVGNIPAVREAFKRSLLTRKSTDHPAENSDVPSSEPSGTPAVDADNQA